MKFLFCMDEKQNKRLLLCCMMSKFIPRKGTQDRLGFWTPHCGFRISGTELQYLYKKNLDSGACFSKGPETFRARRQILKSKSVE